MIAVRAHGPLHRGRDSAKSETSADRSAGAYLRLAAKSPSRNPLANLIPMVARKGDRSPTIFLPNS